ncbi:TenA family protein [Shimia abyssi]|uniref:Aminopyrimidine aminohydrolase n=1 Tax=Shimia abyssi TaxID=1662395 RepID=A0A2P8EX57_9RHOB|nr:TenA family protein [Shimia abyssi]PSL14051.1 thiaminase/transcriptional activator TenA [Shimia abyssi]
MRATDYLRSQVAEDWTAATTHAFTNALVDGSLSREKMAGYLQQDYLFVEEFVRLLASAVAHAPNLADGVPAAQFLGQICGPENTYFLRALEALEVPQAQTEASETLAFQQLMASARLSGRYEIMLSVLVVAEWVYLEWATPHEDRAENLPFWFGEWITLHSGQGFSEVVSYLRKQLDTAWETLGAAEREDVQITFTKAVALERAFFDASWLGFKVDR